MRCRVRCGYGGLDLVINWVHDKDRAIYLDDDDNTAEKTPADKVEPRSEQGEKQLQRSTEQRPICMHWQNVCSCKWGAECRFDTWEEKEEEMARSVWVAKMISKKQSNASIRSPRGKSGTRITI